MYIPICVQNLINKLKDRYYVLRYSHDYIERLERKIDELAIELDEQEYFARCKAEDAEHERENLQYELDRKQDIIDDYAREEQERRDREYEDEQQHYRSYCPHCGSQYRLGRCPACDEAFGRN